MNRWEWIEGIKAVSASQVAVRELNKMLVKELTGWPVQVDWCDEKLRQRYAEILVASAPPPAAAALTESFKLLRWELSRQFDAIEHYERNHLLEQACPAPTDQLACAFLRSYLSEAFLELIERTENRVTRSQILAGLGDLEARLQQAWQQGSV